MEWGTWLGEEWDALTPALSQWEREHGKGARERRGRGAEEIRSPLPLGEG
jgi:hypothetical protein